MQCLLRNVRVVKIGYAVRFGYGHLMDILDMTLSNVLAASYIATCVRSVEVYKMFLKHQGLLSFLMELRKDASDANSLAVMHVDDPRCNISSEAIILFMI